MRTAVAIVALLQASPSLDNLPTPAARIATTTLAPVTFTATTPLASNAELARRTLTPLQVAQLPALLATRHARLADQPITPAQEQFGVRRPPQSPPAAGYGLLVFVPPWSAAALPSAWLPALDAAGIIVVTAARQGNSESPLGRREPLALVAAANALQRYPIDPARVYVAGFSGGAKVALKLALAYPDLFRGVLADAGADPVGTAALPLPPVALFEKFRRGSKVVLVAGSSDTTAQETDAAAGSLHAWCVANVTLRTVTGLGHEPVGGSDFAHALAALIAPPHEPGTREEACWQRRLAQRDAALAAVAATIDTPAARRKLDALDHVYGGIAAPGSVALAQRLAPSAR